MINKKDQSDPIDNLEYEKVLGEEIINSNFKKKREERSAYLGEEGSKEIEKKIFLQLIDLNWKNHIAHHGLQLVTSCGYSIVIQVVLR